MNAKFEKILIGVILVILLIISIILYSGHQETGDMVKLSVDGEIYGEFPLDEDKVINISDKNIIEIKSSTVQMIEAKCPNHLCVDQGMIMEVGDSIVCLPHRLIITIEALDGKE